jgi:hypothetical protein
MWFYGAKEIIKFLNIIVRILKHGKVKKNCQVGVASAANSIHRGTQAIFLLIGPFYAKLLVSLKRNNKFITAGRNEL